AGRLTGSAQQALEWLRSHPRLAAWAPALGDIDLRGDTFIDVEASVPAASAGHVAVAGPRVRVAALLDGGTLRPVAGLPPIEALHGTLGFAAGHLQRSTLTGEWLGGPVSLGVAERREHELTTLTISARGLTDARRAVEAAGGNADNAQLAGNAEWSALLTLRGGADPRSGGWELHADSSLLGVASRLPEPFAKAAGAAVPLHVEMQAGSDSGQLHVSLGDRLRAVAALTRSGDTWRIERGAVRLAATAPALPTDPAMLLDGRLSRLDLPACLALWREAGRDAALPLLRARVTAGQLLVGARAYPEASVVADAAHGAGGFELESEGFSASVRWPGPGDARPARVHLATFNIAQPADAMLAAALGRVLAPAAEVFVDDLHWQGHPMGSLALRVAAHADVLELTDVRLSGAATRAYASARCQDAACHLTLSLDSADAAATLAAFGLRPDVEAHRARLEGEIGWSSQAPVPLATLYGHLHMQLEDGATRIGGAGQPFALLSVPALVASSADAAEAADGAQPELSFTRLDADYELRDGVASTSDLHFDGDAEILVHGRIGLVAADYDEQAWVLRGEDRLPAAVRRLGPTPRVAAAWLSLRELFGEPAAGHARATLRLRGTWNDPIVTPAE
ncbi:MAG TPA: AsmA-like C-terminal region-containing protein, partial [Steroidobacteraceae bacterium]|nr:AsmA-like C-terminal region-containing protein [Steroidobacteraceae bacterium]